MKRNQALIRKLRGLSEESRQGLLDDIAKTNQSKVGVGGSLSGGGRWGCWTTSPLPTKVWGAGSLKGLEPALALCCAAQPAALALPSTALPPYA